MISGFKFENENLHRFLKVDSEELALFYCNDGKTHSLRVATLEKHRGQAFSLIILDSALNFCLTRWSRRRLWYKMLSVTLIPCSHNNRVHKISLIISSTATNSWMVELRVVHLVFVVWTGNAPPVCPLISWYTANVASTYRYVYTN